MNWDWDGSNSDNPPIYYFKVKIPSIGGKGNVLGRIAPLGLVIQTENAVGHKAPQIDIESKVRSCMIVNALEITGTLLLQVSVYNTVLDWQ